MVPFPGQRFFGCTYQTFMEECSLGTWNAEDRHYTHEAPLGFPKEEEVLMCLEYSEQYEGSLYVLWTRDGKFYENELSHCSCNSYSDDTASWSAPALEVTVEYLRKRYAEYYWFQRFMEEPGFRVLMDYMVENT